MKHSTFVVIVISFFSICFAEAQQEKQKYRRWIPRDRTSFSSFKEEGYPLNENPKIIPASEADLVDDDLIMGAVINGEARAYPVNYMNGPYNEVVNDILGGQPIAPSW